MIEMVNRIIIYNLIIYFSLIFFSKGEAIRNIIIYASFVLWLMTIKSKYSYLKEFLRDKITIFFLLFLVSLLISCLFSYNPEFSISQVKGEPLKAFIMFILASTSFNNKKVLSSLPKISLLVMLIIISLGLYTYLFEKSYVFTALTSILHANPNKFVFYINWYFAFAVSLYFYYNKSFRFSGIIIFFLLTFILLVFFLNSSREGLLNLFSILILWMFFAYKHGYKIKKFIFSLIFIFLAVFIFAWNSSPYLQQRIKATPEHLSTFNLRIPTWISGLSAWLEKPIVGWGYGDKFFQDPQLYASINKTPPQFGPHNMFLRILFHTGILGLITYCLFLFLAIKRFFKKGILSQNLQSLILFSITTSLIGNFIIHSFFSSSPQLHWVSFLVGIGLAVEKDK